MTVCSYTPHAPKANPPTKLAFASSDSFSLDSAILHTRKHGAGLDSSWRHKNENYAPLTLFITVNKLGRMVPSEFKSHMEG